MTVDDDGMYRYTWRGIMAKRLRTGCSGFALGLGVGALLTMWLGHVL